MLGNGAGKNRGKTDGGLRPTPSWAVLFLSWGEATPAQHMASAHLKPMEGQRVRMPSIPAEPEGCIATGFETNHNPDGGRELSQHMERQSALH